MPKWYQIPVSVRMTDGEYSANITGMNVVFGAVLGFVLAGTEALDTQQFIYVLLLAAATVVTILYLGSSAYKLFYGVMGTAMVIALPFLLKQMEVGPNPKLQATLGVWLAVVIGLELMPRVKPEPPAESEES